MNSNACAFPLSPFLHVFATHFSIATWVCRENMASQNPGPSFHHHFLRWNTVQYVLFNGNVASCPIASDTPNWMMVNFFSRWYPDIPDSPSSNLHFSWYHPNDNPPPPSQKIIPHVLMNNPPCSLVKSAFFMGMGPIFPTNSNPHMPSPGSLPLSPQTPDVPTKTTWISAQAGTDGQGRSACHC